MCGFRMRAWRICKRNLVRSQRVEWGSRCRWRGAGDVGCCRANVLAKGLSGCRTAVPELLVALLNGRGEPVIRRRGRWVRAGIWRRWLTWRWW